MAKFKLRLRVDSMYVDLLSEGSCAAAVKNKILQHFSVAHQCKLCGKQDIKVESIQMHKADFSFTEVTRI